MRLVLPSLLLHMRKNTNEHTSVQVKNVAQTAKAGVSIRFRKRHDTDMNSREALQSDSLNIAKNGKEVKAGPTVRTMISKTSNKEPVKAKSGNFAWGQNQRTTHDAALVEFFEKQHALISSAQNATSEAPNRQQLKNDDGKKNCATTENDHLYLKTDEKEESFIDVDDEVLLQKPLQTLRSILEDNIPPEKELIDLLRRANYDPVVVLSEISFLQGNDFLISEVTQQPCGVEVLCAPSPPSLFPFVPVPLPSKRSPISDQGRYLDVIPPGIPATKANGEITALESFYRYYDNIYSYDKYDFCSSESAEKKRNQMIEHDDSGQFPSLEAIASPRQTKAKDQPSNPCGKSSRMREGSSQHQLPRSTNMFNIKVSPHSATGGARLKIVTLNCLHDVFDSAALVHTSLRIPLIYDELKKIDADIILLQEITPKFLENLRMYKEEGVNCGDHGCNFLVDRYFWTSLKTLPSESNGPASSVSSTCVAEDNQVHSEAEDEATTTQITLSKIPIKEAVSYHSSKFKRAVFTLHKLLYHNEQFSVAQNAGDGSVTAASQCQIAGVNPTTLSLPAYMVVCNVHLVSDYGGPNAVRRRMHEINDYIHGAKKKYEVQNKFRTTRRDTVENKAYGLFTAPWPVAVIGGDFNFGDQNEEQHAIDWGHFEDAWLATHALSTEFTPRDHISAGYVPTNISPVGGFTFDPTSNPLAALCCAHHMYPRRLDRVLIKGLLPSLSCTTFGTTGVRVNTTTQVVADQIEGIKLKAEEKKQQLNDLILKTKQEQQLNYGHQHQTFSIADALSNVKSNSCKTHSTKRLFNSEDAERVVASLCGAPVINDENDTPKLLLHPSDHFGVIAVTDLYRQEI